MNPNINSLQPLTKVGGDMAVLHRVDGGNGLQNDASVNCAAAIHIWATSETRSIFKSPLVIIILFQSVIGMML